MCQSVYFLVVLLFLKIKRSIAIMIRIYCTNATQNHYNVLFYIVILPHTVIIIKKFSLHLSYEHTSTMDMHLLLRHAVLFVWIGKTGRSSSQDIHRVTNSYHAHRRGLQLDAESRSDVSDTIRHVPTDKMNIYSHTNS